MPYEIFDVPVIDISAPAGAPTFVAREPRAAEGDEGDNATDLEEPGEPSTE